jgi:hypothetical protein
VPSIPETFADFYAKAEISRDIALTVAAIVGIGLATWPSIAASQQAKAALQQTELARRDHITEIFNRAVGQLADDKLEVRLGAVYTLKAILEDDQFGRYTAPITEWLAAYVRLRTASQKGPPEQEVQAINDVLRNQKWPKSGQR